MITIKSIRSFIGSKDFNESRAFYLDVGFNESKIDDSMSLFYIDSFSFYLQNAYVKDWVNNTMLFLEIEEPDLFREHLLALKLNNKFSGVKITGMVYQDWGEEFFMHDPAGNLWHVGKFK